MKSGRCLRSRRMVMIVSIAAGMPAIAADNAARSVADLSLEELMNVQVVSGAKKLQRIGDSAAAVFVITADDIRRSGAASIPEALRLAPGVEVARFGSGKWAVSIRGSNGQFANKLLVLMDGRTLYTPLFAGVQWEMHDTVLEDVERIEVIRGPGASLWGANAVNGVINIITRHSKDTQGGLVSAAAGSVERAVGAVRYGGKLGDDGTYRVYAKGFARDRFPDATGQSGRDDFNAGTAGFRLDHSSSAGDLVVQGNVYRSKLGDRLTWGQYVPPYQTVTDIDQIGKGFNLLARWEGGRQDGSATSVQAFVDQADFQLGWLVEKRRTFDLEVQRRTPIGRHDVIYGFGYRMSHDEISSADFFLADPTSRTTHLWSAFVQDEISLIPERVRLTLGARWEHNVYTGNELQPNARLIWTPTPTQSLWASAARAVRTPARYEVDGRVRIQVIPPATAFNPGPLPAEVALMGNRDIESERLESAEIGYRNQLSPQVAFDVSMFQHRYRDLRTFVAGAAQPQLLVFPPYVLMPMTASNVGSGEVRGFEFSGEYRPAAWWRLSASMAHQQLDFRDPTGPDAMTSGSSPRHTYSLRSAMNLGSNVELDLWLRRVGALPGLNVPAYTSLDGRLGWKMSRNVEVSLVGQNLLDQRHPEFVSDFVGTATYEVPRGAYVKVEAKF